MKTLSKMIMQLAAFALAMALSVAASAQAPANDACTGAIALSCGQTVTGSTLASNIDTAPVCGLTFPRYGVWYRITGTGGAITLSTCNVGTNYDTQIGVYSGSCTALSCVAGNNNDAACSRSGRYSTVTFNSNFGTTYYVWVTGVLSARGNFALSATCAAAALPNDDCGGAISLAVGSTCTFASYSNAGAGASAGVPAPGCAFYSGGDVWFRAVVPANGQLIIETQSGVVTDGGMAIYSGSCAGLTLIECDDDDGPGLMPLINRTGLTPGSTIYIRFWEYGNNNNGTFGICVSSPTAPPPPPGGDNNSCANATPIACGGTATGTTATATLDGPATSCTGGSVAADRWYTVVGTGGNITASTCGGTTYDSKLDIYTGACGALTSVACNDDACGLQSTVTWSSVAGTTYRIRVHGFGGATGSFTLSVTCAITLDDDVSARVSDNNVDLVGDFYPNPAQNGLSMLDINTTQDGEAVITLFDALGRIVSDRKEGVSAGFNQVRLNVASLSAGTYFAVVTVNGQQFHKKLVVNR